MLLYNKSANADAKVHMTQIFTTTTTFTTSWHIPWKTSSKGTANANQPRRHEFRHKYTMIQTSNVIIVNITNNNEYNTKGLSFTVYITK